MMTSMRRAAPYVVMAALAAAIVVLVLNLRERDDSLDGRLEPPAGPINVEPDDGALAWLPRTIEHDGCVHRAEFVENLRWLRLRDRDGWYRLFWAGDEAYYFEDPAHFNAAMKNPTFHDPSGEWKIAIAYRAANCPERILRLRFSLVVTTDLIPTSDETVEIAGVRGPKFLRWFIAQIPGGLRIFLWRLEP